MRKDEELAGGSEDPDTLSILASSDDREVRRLVAGNHATPAAVLVRLAGDKSRSVRCELAANAMMPAAAAALLLLDGDALVIEIATKNVASLVREAARSEERD